MSMINNVSSRLVDSNSVNSTKQFLNTPTKVAIVVVAVAILAALGYYLLRTCGCLRRSNRHVQPENRAQRPTTTSSTISSTPLRPSPKSTDSKSTDKDGGVPSIYGQPNPEGLTLMGMPFSPLSTFSVPTHPDLNGTLSESDDEEGPFEQSLIQHHSEFPLVSVDSVEISAEQTPQSDFSEDATTGSLLFPDQESSQDMTPGSPVIVKDADLSLSLDSAPTDNLDPAKEKANSSTDSDQTAALTAGTTSTEEKDSTLQVQKDPKGQKPLERTRPMRRPRSEIDGRQTGLPRRPKGEDGKIFYSFKPGGSNLYKKHDDQETPSSASFPPAGDPAATLPLPASSSVGSLPKRLPKQASQTSLTAGRLPTGGGVGGHVAMGFGNFNAADIRAGLRKTGGQPESPTKK